MPSVELTQSPEVIEEPTIVTPSISVEEVAPVAEEAAPTPSISVEEVAPTPATEEAAPAAKGEEEGQKPAGWTPSYSVSTQGSSPVGTPLVQAAKPEAEVPSVVLEAPKVEEKTVEEPAEVSFF